MDGRRRRGAGLLVLGGVGLAVLAVAAAGAGLGGRHGPAGGAGAADRQPVAPRFVEEALAANIEHAYTGESEFVVGGGAAVLDCDSDGYLDVYLAGGSAPAALFRNQSAPGGALAFERLLAEVTDLEAVTGAYPLDVDGDGLTDLAVLRRGENVLLRGLGACRFERANEAWGFDGGDAWTTSFSATWQDGDSWPTLAFGNYLEEPSMDHARQCDDNELHRPSPDGGYVDSLALSPGWCSLSLLFSDWDRSGRRDLRVSNDRHYYSDHSGGQEQLWRLDPTAEPRLYTADDGWQAVRIWGMGIASHDVTGEGYPDYYLTSQGDNKLQALADGADQPRFRDLALDLDATAHRPFAGGETLPSTAWHAEFDDVNNDGLMDLFVAKGNVETQLDHASRDPNNMLLGQSDGTFAEAADDAGIVHFARTRGAALADFNNDGLLDLLEVNRRENVKLWRNVGAGTGDAPRPLGNWLTVRPRQAGSNGDAIGAWVQLRVGEQTTEREVVVGGGHAGGGLGPIHFGLGTAAAADVRVIWPDGAEGEWQTVEANRVIEVER